MEEELESDRDMYTEEGVDECFDNDEISSMEEGFMLGYLAAV